MGVGSCLKKRVPGREDDNDVDNVEQFEDVLDKITTRGDTRTRLLLGLGEDDRDWLRGGCSVFLLGGGDDGR